MYRYNFLLGICLSMYPGLTNTRVKLPKIVRSSCFMILGIHFITTRKIQEIPFQGFQISKFSRGACPRTPLDGSRLRREIVPPNFNVLAPPLIGAQHPEDLYIGVQQPKDLYIGGQPPEDLYIRGRQPEDIHTYRVGSQKTCIYKVDGQKTYI